MLAIYDTAPPGWGFLSFLVSAELHRRALRPEERLTVQVVKPEGLRPKTPSLLPHMRDGEAWWALYHDIMHPLASMLPHLESISTRDGPPTNPRELVFPYGYTAEHRRSLHGREHLMLAFHQDCFPLDIEAPKEDLITITPGTDTEIWRPIAEWLPSRVVFVADNPVEGWETIRATNVGQLAKLYASAKLNLGVDSACAWMAAAMPRVSYMMYEPENLPKGYQVGRGGFKICGEISLDAVKADVADNFRSLRGRPVHIDKPHPMGEVWVRNMRVNCARDLPWFETAKRDPRPAVICAGGSSLADNWQYVRRRWRSGQVIFACNGVGSALISRGIVPNYVCALDANPKMAEYFFQNTHPDTEYLIASCCDPSLVDHLLDRGCKVCLWHAAMANTAEEDGILEEFAPKRMAWPQAFGGSVTIGARTPILAWAKGHREHHLYGMDSCYRNREHHAYDHPHKGLDKYQRVGFDFGGRAKEYDAAPWMVRQADEFRDTYWELRRLGVHFMPHGDGIIPDMCRWFNKQEVKAAA